MGPKSKKRLANASTTALEVAGLAAVTYGIYQLAVPAAWIFAGLSAIGLSFLLVWKGNR